MNFMNHPLTPYWFYLAGCLAFLVASAAQIGKGSSKWDKLYFACSVAFTIGTIIGMGQVWQTIK